VAFAMYVIFQVFQALRWSFATGRPVGMRSVLASLCGYTSVSRQWMTDERGYLRRKS
jgi:hypothetical protein